MTAYGVGKLESNGYIASLMLNNSKVESTGGAFSVMHFHSHGGTF